MRPTRLIPGTMYAVCLGILLAGCGKEKEANASRTAPTEDSQVASPANEVQMATTAVTKPKVEFPDKHVAFLDSYCMDCHDADTEKGSVNLEALSFKIETIEQAETWQKSSMSSTLVRCLQKRRSSPSKRRRQIS